jgi:hypothetical protein
MTLYYIFPIYLFIKNIFFINFRMLLFIEILFLTIFVGLRHEIGGDWESYEHLFKHFSNYDIFEFIKINSITNDFGYFFLGNLVSNFGLSIHYSNLVCSFICILAIYSYSSCFKKRDLVIFILYSYTVIVIFMGYTRQATAVSIMIIAFTYSDKRLFSYLSGFLALLFHKTVIILYPLYIHKKISFFIFSFIFILYMYTFYNNIQLMFVNYILTNKASGGYYIRIIMILPPTVLLFCYRKNIESIFEGDTFWSKNIYKISIISLPMILIIGLLSTTVADRFLIIYLMLSCPFWSYPFLSNSYSIRMLSYIIIPAVPIFTMTAWLLYANTASSWMPYNSLLFQ